MSNAKQISHPSEAVCGRVFEMFGDRWTLRIVSALRDGELRFKEIEKTLSINSATLTTRLKKLEDLALVIRNEETIDKLSVTYKLTKSGTDLLPIYDGIVKFGEKMIKP
ncbi:MAG: helix-turn-helix domain-containing protein [Patescibacteria group bacterium]